MARFFNKVGLLLRETGQSLDRLGCRIQGNEAFKEQLSRHRNLMNLYDIKPKVGEGSWVAPDAAVIGDVTIGKNSSVWYGTVLRADVNRIKIGDDTNIQDRTVIHVENPAKDQVTEIGSRVTIGHGAVLHSCVVEDDSLIGMGSTIGTGVHVGKNAIVGAAAVVAPHTHIPSGELWAGNPAKKVRNIKPDELNFFKFSADEYALLAKDHASEHAKLDDVLAAERAARKTIGERGGEFDRWPQIDALGA